jgi:hypothetical protein
MRRPITIAIATMGLVALMFWLGMGATGKDAAVISDGTQSLNRQPIPLVACLCAMTGATALTKHGRTA